jgi:hypothetical protein
MLKKNYLYLNLLLRINKKLQCVVVHKSSHLFNIVANFKEVNNSFFHCSQFFHIFLFVAHLKSVSIIAFFKYYFFQVSVGFRLSH